VHMSQMRDGIDDPRDMSMEVLIFNKTKSSAVKIFMLVEIRK